MLSKKEETESGVVGVYKITGAVDTEDVLYGISCRIADVMIGQVLRGGVKGAVR